VLDHRPGDDPDLVGDDVPHGSVGLGRLGRGRKSALNPYRDNASTVNTL
jgi:hypothetical protein